MPPVELIAKGLEVAANLLEEAPVASKLLADSGLSARIASTGLTGAEKLGSEAAGSALIVGPRKLAEYPEATRFLGLSKIGGSHPFFAEASDGKRYLMKYLGNPQGDGTLANEWLANPMQRYMAINSPDVAIINISPAFIRSTELANPAFRDLMVKPGPGFGSRLVESAVSSVDDASSVVNLRDFGKTMVADAFVFNFDGTQAMFSAEKASTGVFAGMGRTYRAHMVDNGLAFFGEDNNPSWVTSNWHAPLYGSGPGYYDFLSKGDIAADVERLQNMPDAVIKDQMRSLPSPWITNPTNLKRAVDLVLQGRDALPTVIQRTINDAPPYFPLIK